MTTVETMTTMSSAKTDSLTPHLPDCWRYALQPEFSKPYMKNLKAFLLREKGEGKVIFPRGEDYFTAFKETLFDSVRVVIIGQDPYHGPGQAHGLAFSVKPGVPAPPSLVNIFKELKSDLNVATPNSGCLLSWARQGVLLLNAVLTVEAGKAGSHQNQGWELFTDSVVHQLNTQKEGLVFVLWGSYAQKKGAFIHRQKHLVLEGPHPSPLSAYRGFFGSRPFSKINAYFRSRDQREINWSL